MKTTDYSSLPSKRMWVWNSAILVGARDPVLKHVDSLVGTANSIGNRDARAYLYFQLYFSLNYWLRYFESNPAMHREREPAIRSLFRFIVRELGRIFDCGVQAVPNVLEEYFGRNLSAHGARMDKAGMAISRQRAMLAKWKLFFNFSNNKFHYLSNGKMNLAHSFEIRASDVNRDDLKEGFANFVLTMGGDLYMAPHGYNRSTKQSFFHSSYNSGEAVLCAGSIKITYGTVDGVQNNSGHYQPTDSYVVNLLKHLQMLGHPVTNAIKVWSYGGQVYVGAKDFLSANGTWQSVIGRQTMRFWNWQGRLEADEAAKTAWRKLQSGTSLLAIVEERYRARANPQMTWANVWDEVILDIMGAGGDYKDLYEKPAPRTPPVPKRKPWK